MKIAKRRITQLAIATIGVGALALSAIGFQWQQTESAKQDVSQSPLLLSANRLLQSTDLVLHAAIRCEGQSCSPSQTPMLQLLTDVKNNIATFQQLASQEKQTISLVGNMLYPQLEVSIDRFIGTSDIRQFQQSIVTSYASLQQAQQNLVSAKQTAFEQQQQSLFSLAILIAVLTGSVLCGLTLVQSLTTNRKKQSQPQEHSIEKLAAQLENIDTQAIHQQLNRLDTSPAERRIFANLAAMYEDVEQQKRHADLYRQLYALIGYEIRGMTNTIQGGVRLLAQDAGENGAVMARDISLATNTLSDLADNYNRLISGGSKDTSGDVTFLPLLSELVVHLSAKTQHTQGVLECHLDDNLPEVIEGNATSLFWVLFLQLSNAISAQNEPYILLSVRNQAADEVEQTRLVFEIIFLPTYALALPQIQQASWQQIEEKSGINDEWSKAILTKVNHFGSSWSQADCLSQDDTQTQMQKLQISIDITPKRFYRTEPTLENKRFMVCTDSELQIDIMSRMLERYSAQVEVIRSANDIFKSLPRMNDFDAILITDTIKGIQLKSFCKTLHSRLKKARTKLLLAASESSTVQDTHEFVDRVFYTPFIPHELVPNLVEAIQDTEQANEQRQHAFLIVEDDKVQQFLLKKLLSKQGYDAHTVSDGAQAVEYMKDHGADIVFMDCIMPGMGGIEATKLIRQREVEQDSQPATIIGATALTSASEHKSCIEAGMDYVISKPYKNDEIIKVIKKYMAIQKIC
ncbi:two-component system response regulator [Photobacterium jeanii]|uniref:Two-component system response regulator n=1 Tax=Photobacterium jeanii TaxID=858640 RepID=A0A178KN12_9GAMM|nr:response regulator [Photobacterium jeanii]OAN18063.1 two-component system response regulator [Photobacterium jeanii]PST92265.1 hybrid sensor histidine kinase/response regulator [Photobacterium jeanii]